MGIGEQLGISRKEKKLKKSLHLTKPKDLAVRKSTLAKFLRISPAYVSQLLAKGVIEQRADGRVNLGESLIRLRDHAKRSVFLYGKIAIRLGVWEKERRDIARMMMGIDFHSILKEAKEIEIEIPEEPKDYKIPTSEVD